MNNERVKEIKKALECCKELKSPCGNCPYHGNDCVEKLNSDMEDYINELENLCNKTYEDLTKEIDRLEKENVRLDKVVKHNQELIEDGKLISSEQLKQFAERLFEKYSYDKLTHEDDEDIEIHLTASELDETLKEFINVEVE